MYSNTVGLVHHVFLGSARPIYLFGRGSYCSSGDIRDVHIYIYISVSPIKQVNASFYLPYLYTIFWRTIIEFYATPPVAFGRVFCAPGSGVTTVGH